ncbi:diguanylate cyclase domain-containing protein [Kineococcus gypseus]|uniref:diguanylate cyclase domain-containing protein n=1 Tax=Kineococcus gypseus TaxID=1637102 RepID=UPI003D7C44E5
MRSPSPLLPARGSTGRGTGAPSAIVLEAERLAALHAYDVLDAPAATELDDVVRAAAMVAGVPHATLNLIDADRQCQLTTVGFEGADSAREDSMCALHFADGQVVHARDAALDERYRTNPWVDGRLGRVRLYASAPLLSPDGHALGSLCVFDTAPGELSQAQLDALEGLARVVVALFERSRQARAAEDHAARAREHAAEVQRLAERDAELRSVLAASEQRFRTAFDTAPVGMLIVGLGGRDAGRVLQVNSTLCAFTGLSAAQLLTREVHDLAHPDDRVHSALALAPFLLGERAHGQVEQRYRHADGSVRWGLLTATAMNAAVPGPPAPGERGEPGEPGETGRAESEPQLLCLIEDVTARRAAEDALRHQALHDALTGLPNRTLLHDRLAHALAAAGRSGAGVGVLFCDLDGFKAVNDSAGHAAGDELLREVASRFSACLRPTDTLARLGGDEFAAVCPGTTRGEDLRAIAERLLGALREPVTTTAGTFTVGVSIGTHLARPDLARRTAGGCGDGGPGAVEHALARADGAMYEAKRAGRNRVHPAGEGVAASTLPS